MLLEDDLISSMTGYGRSDDQNEDILLSVEIKSVNSRFLDFSSRLPKTLVPFEEDAFRIIKNRCYRGRVTLFAKIDFTTNGRKKLQLNHDKLDEYMVIIKEIQKLLIHQMNLQSL